MSGPLGTLSAALVAAEPRDRVRHALRFQLAHLLKQRGGKPSELRSLFERLDEAARDDPPIPCSEATLLGFLQDPTSGGNCHVAAAIAAMRACARDIPGKLAIYDAHIEYLRPNMWATRSFDGQKLRRLCSVTDLAGVRRAFVTLPLRYAGLRRRVKWVQPPPPPLPPPPEPPVPTTRATTACYYIGDEAWELVDDASSD